MKHHIADLLSQAVAQLQQQGVLPTDQRPAMDIERTRRKEHGDFACNVALTLARAAKAKPRDLAQQIVAALPPSKQIAKVEIAGPGFINFFLTTGAYQHVVAQVFDAGETYGHSDIGDGRRVQVEFVSANPTGPLHVGHGRQAALGGAIPGNDFCSMA